MTLSSIADSTELGTHTHTPGTSQKPTPLPTFSCAKLRRNLPQFVSFLVYKKFLGKGETHKDQGKGRLGASSPAKAR